MPSSVPLPKRASCQATASEPSLPAAIAPSVLPSRTRALVSGSFVPTVCTSAIGIGADHVAPLSAERMIDRRAAVTLVPLLSSCVKKFSTVPSGSPTIWLLIVWLLGPGL